DRWPRVGRAWIDLKSGDYDNELSRFRYDVTLEIGAKQEIENPNRWLGWSQDGSWEPKLRHIFRENSAAAVGLRGIQDGRVAPAIAVLHLLESQNPNNAAELRKAGAAARGEDPNRIMGLAAELGKELHWRAQTSGGRWDAIFNPRWKEKEAASAQPAAF